MPPSRTQPAQEDTITDVYWPPSVLDLEPEVCHCLPHGSELPCSLCGKKHSIREPRP